MGSEMSCPCSSNVNINEEPTSNPDYLAEMEKFTISSKQMIYGNYNLVLFDLSIFSL